MAVCATRRLVIISNGDDHRLYCYGLDDGKLVKVLGRGKGRGDGQFNFLTGGLCVTHAGTVLVADGHNDRVPEVDLDGDGSCFVRELGVDMVYWPHAVECTLELLAVSQENSVITVLSLHDNTLVTRLGGYNDLKSPRGMHFMCDAGGGVTIAVANWFDKHVVIFRLDGSIACVCCGEDWAGYVYDVVSCDNGAALLVASDGRNSLLKVSVGAPSAPTRLLQEFGSRGDADNCFRWPCALALLPDNTLVVREYLNERFQVFSFLTLRVAWLHVVVRMMGRD